MKGIGSSLARQMALAGLFDSLYERVLGPAREKGRAVWFLGRDADPFYVGVRVVEELVGVPRVARYLPGLNREVTRKLAHRRRLGDYLRRAGVHQGDHLVDTGWRGSIYARLEDAGVLPGPAWLISAAPDRVAGLALYEAPRESAVRHAVLAIEHTPKIYTVHWDGKRRVPVFTATTAKERKAALRFLRGFAVEMASFVLSVPPGEEVYRLAGRIIRKEVDMR